MTAYRLGRQLGFVALTTAALLLTACSGSDCKNIIRGSRYDGVGKCLAGEQELGCASTPGCDDAVAWALDSQGHCFYFTTLCIPSDFTVLRYDDTRCPSTGTPVPACPN